MKIRSIEPKLWSEIGGEPADEGIVVRRVLPELTHDVFVGERRPSRERVLLLNIKGPAVGLPKRRPCSKGLDVVVDSSAPDLTKVRLTSTSSQGNPLFEELADDVVGVLGASPREGAAARVLERVIAWQSFFAQRPDGFSAEKAAGLFAELTVLRDSVIPALGASSGVTAWSGPDPAVQDFQFGDIAVEVKSYRGTGPGHLTISSEHQLDTIGVGSLFVAYLRIDQRGEGTGATLSRTIDSVRAALGASPFAQDLLDAKLLSYGWHESYGDFRNEKFETRSNEVFAVVDGFPRIVAADLDRGVGGVSYLIDRSAIDDFLVRGAEFNDRLKEQV